MITKLVRDRCGAVLDGECEPTETEAEYQMALLLKAHEEIQEIADCPTDPEEYADLLEVMLILADYNDVDGEDILEALVDKRKRLGGFEDGQIWTEGGPVGRMEPPHPNIVVEVDVDFRVPAPTPQDFGFAPSREQVCAKLRGVPAWLAHAMKRPC